MTSQSGQQRILIHIFPNISRSKGNQTIKLAHVTWDKVFLKNHTQNVTLDKKWPVTKCDPWQNVTSPRPFSEKLKLSISLDQ